MPSQIMTENYYDSDRGISEYLLFHYAGHPHPIPGAMADGLNFPQRCVTECVRSTGLPAKARALDLGCAVGRSSFELARHCVSVIGIDYSTRFIDVANHLKTNGSFNFGYIEEGELTLPHSAVVPPEIDRTRVAFERGDALNLRADLGTFDIVLLSNLIDRLADPAHCLARLPELVTRGGQLVITSPYTWLLDYTPRDKWLGGFMGDGQPVRTFDTLQKLLSPHFNLKTRQDLPFVLREHARKFQLGFAEASVWVRQ